MEIPSTVRAEDEAADRLMVTCVCSARFMVKRELMGKRIKCPKCGQGLEVPSGPDQPTVTVSGRMSRPAMPDVKSFDDWAVEVERQEPLMDQPLVLKEWMSKGKLKKLANAIEKKNGEGKAEAELRRQSVLQLGETADARAAGMLIPLATDYWISVREGVAEALGTLRDPASVPTLVRLLGDEVPDVKRDAVVSLGKIGDARAVRPLLEIALREPLFRFTAGEAVIRIGKSAVQILVQILKEADPSSALEAIIVLGRIKDPAATEPLAGMLNHRFAIVRSHAAESLGLIGDARAAVPLIRTLSDPDPVVRAQAAAALQKVGDKRAVPPLMALLSDLDLDVCTRAAITLGELGDPQAAPALLSLLERAEPELRGAVADALGKLGNEIAAEPLTRLFHDPDESVRLKAVSAFRRFRSAPAIVPLLQLLDDVNVGIRQRAVDALGEIGNIGALERLMVTLRSDAAVEVRMAAAKALGLLRSPKALKALEEALDDDLTVRCRAIAALGDIGDASSLPALLAMLKDPTPEVRYHASQALAEVGHQNSRKPLEDLLADENAMVRRGAAKALIKLGDPRGEALLEQATKSAKSTVGLQLSQWLPDSVLGLLSPSSATGQLALIMLVGVPLLGLGGYFLGPAIWGLLKPAERLEIRGKPTTVGISADGRQIITGRSRGSAEIWDVASQKRLEVIVFPTNSPVTGSVIAPDGKAYYLAVGNQLYRYVNGSPELLPEHPQSISSLQVSGNGLYAVSLSHDGTVYVIDLATGKVPSSILLPINQVTSFQFSDDCKLAAWGTSIGEVNIFDVEKEAVVDTFRLGEKAINSLAFSPDGAQLAVSSVAAQLVVRDVASKKTVLKLPLESGQVAGYGWLTYSRDGQRVLGISGELLTSINLADKSKTSEIMKGVGSVDLVAIDSQGKNLVVAGREEHPVWVWNIEENKVVGTLNR